MYIILSAIPLLLGTLVLFIMTYYFIVRNRREVSKVKYVLYLIGHYLCSFTLTIILAIWMKVFNQMWPYVIIVEFISLPTFLALCRYFLHSRFD